MFIAISALVKKINQLLNVYIIVYLHFVQCKVITTCAAHTTGLKEYLLREDKGHDISLHLLSHLFPPQSAAASVAVALLLVSWSTNMILYV